MAAQIVRAPCSLCGGILVIRVTHDGPISRAAMQDHRCTAPQEDAS